MGQRILSIDDNEIVGWTLAARLWVAGYDVETVCSVNEACQVLRENTYDLVLIDLEMPDCGGLDALDILKREQLCPDVPVVLLTSSDYFGHVQQAYARGARGYLTKGFASTKLIKNIDRLMKSDDVVWIDDLHCVSKRAMLDDAEVDRFPPESDSAATEPRRSENTPHLKLVSTSNGAPAQTLGIC